MKAFTRAMCFLIAVESLLAAFTTSAAVLQTRVSIVDGRWHINGQLTHRGAKAEGLLLNVRMVNATFEDSKRPEFDAEANTGEFIAQIPNYVAQGVRAFTLSLQGGMPGYEGALNSAFNADGSLRESHMARIRRVIEACDQHGAVVILGCYYQRQDQVLQGEEAVRAGVVNVVKWIQAAGFGNVVLEIANEFGHSGFNHPILKRPEGQVELIQLAKRTAPDLLVSTSGLGDGAAHESVARACDFLLVHFNSTRLEEIPKRIASLKRYAKPIVCNEDQKWGEEGAKVAELCTANGASWGLMLEKLNQHFPFTFQGPADDPVVYAALKQLASVQSAATARAGTGLSGETLYNGIVLPREWPPRLADFPTSVEKEPVIPPYLTSPPEVIPIDLGRQLFVDDFLIAETSLKRTFHLAKYYPANPVLKPDKPWEMKNPDHAAAMVFSDGVWYDPKDELFKMWYMVGQNEGTGYATSRDGIHWDKPIFDVRPGTSIVQPGGRDSSTVWLDLEEKDPARRFKMFRVIGAGGADPVTEWNNWAMAIHFSPDGIHWGDPVARTGRMVDRSTVFWNPFRQVWVYSIRHVYKVGDAVDKRYGFPRRRSYVEGPDVLAAARWEVNDPLRWTDVDRLDPQRDDLKIKPHLYNLDAVAYESLMVGFFTIWRGQPADRHKPNNVVLGYSRDGWHWSRPDRRAFTPVSDKQGDWNANNVQSAGGGFLVVGDQLYFYVSGRTGLPGGNKAGTCTTGLATLRRDGFASMDADAMGGTLTTRPVRFTGKHLFVNVDDPNGELRVEILNQAGQVVPRFSAENCVPVTVNKTLQAVRWRGVEDLASLAKQPVRFRFHLKSGELYSFWVSPESSGSSQGYVAAGGPGFSSNRDTGASSSRN